MKQFNWNHIDQTGKLHKVGLLHGSRTGHVLIHVNGKISSIDFKVLDTKSYSFFINEELIELNIIRHDDHFEYSMEINEEVKTPLNERRSKERRKMGLQTLAFFGIMMAIVIGFSLWMVNSKWYSGKNEEQLNQLDQIGIYTQAKMFVSDDGSYHYEFVDRRQNLIRGKGAKATTQIKNGDEYSVQYLPHNPKINKVVFAKPTEYQVRKTVVEGIRICQENDNSKSEGLCVCIVQSAVESGGFPGLQAYIDQNEDADKLLDSKPFKAALKACLKE